MLRAARIASSGSRSCGAPRSEVRHRGWAPRPNQGPLSAAPSLSACRDTASPPPINPHALTLQSVARCQSAAPARAPREVRAKAGVAAAPSRSCGPRTSARTRIACYACAKLYAMTMAVTVTYSQWTGAFHAFPSSIMVLHSALCTSRLSLI
jgi:hypothetical protein